MNNNRNPNFLSAFGGNLRTLRKSKGLSMEKLAQISGVEYSQIFEIEHGNINTTISTVYAISKGLGISYKELFDFEM